MVRLYNIVAKELGYTRPRGHLRYNTFKGGVSYTFLLPKSYALRVDWLAKVQRRLEAKLKHPVKVVVVYSGTMFRPYVAVRVYTQL